MSKVNVRVRVNRNMAWVRAFYLTVTSIVIVMSEARNAVPVPLITSNY